MPTPIQGFARSDAISKDRATSRKPAAEVVVILAASMVVMFMQCGFMFLRLSVAARPNSMLSSPIQPQDNFATSSTRALEASGRR